MSKKVVESNSDDQARKALGRRLRESREYLSLKQEDVAERLGIPRTALGDIESGRRKVEAFELTRLAKLYKQSVSYYTGEDSIAAKLPASVAFMAREASKLSEEDQDELGRFIEYLQARSKGNRG